MPALVLISFSQRPPIPSIVIDRRQQIKANAFKPGWNLPTVSIEEANYIDAQEAMKRHEKEKAKEERSAQPLAS